MTQTTLCVRPFIPQDNSQGVALCINTFSQYAWHETIEPLMTLQSLIRVQRKNPHICFTLENAGKLVGLALGFFRTCHLGVE